MMDVYNVCVGDYTSHHVHLHVNYQNGKLPPQ